MNFDVFAALSSFGGGFLGTIIAFLFVLTIVVFFHELGHFLVARWAGVKVVTFSIGFGPELFGFNDRKGTRWKVSAIPLGGYVKFYGDENAASVPDAAALAKMSPEERKLSFITQPVGPRSLIVAAGPVANFILSIVIFGALVFAYGKPNTSPRVDSIQADSPAAAAGFQVGDIVLAINGRPIATFTDMQRIVSANAGSTIEVSVDRGGAPVVLKATPILREDKDNFGNTFRRGILGITRTMSPSDAQPQPVGLFEAVGHGVSETWFVVESTMTYLGRLVVGRESVDQLGGPIKIAQVSGQVATLGINALLHLAAVLSVSIGLLNLFPIPLLDGGHLLFYAAEAIRGRPLPERAQEYGFRIGLAVILMLMLFTTYQDVLGLSFVKKLLGA